MLDFEPGLWIGRVWQPKASGPAVVTLREGQVIDITAKGAATVSEILEKDHPAEFVQNASGRSLGE